MAELKALQAQIEVMEQNLKDDALKAKDELDTLKKDVIGFIFDEAHQGKGSEIKTILTEMFPKVQIRYGMTGTVPKDYYIRQGEYINNHPTIDIFIKENEECDCFVSVEGNFISFEKNKAPLQILFTNTASTLSSNE